MAARSESPIPLEPLLEWLAIPSVSADPAHAVDVNRAARWLCEQLSRLPGAHVDLYRTESSRHPCVVGRVDASRDRAAAPIVALYGHFDVQPPGPTVDWDSDPFSPDIRDGRIYARGAADSKSNSYVVLEALRQVACAGRLSVNVDLLLDGEEEINGTAICEAASSREEPDAAFICDGALWDERTPQFTASLRGTTYYRVSIQTAERELHSGSFGGAALNAATVLADVLHAVSQLDLGSGGPVDPVQATLVNGADRLRRAGAHPKDATAAADFYRRTVCTSAVDVNSIAAGEPTLRKTVIPERATADVSVRVAPGDDHAAIDEAIRERLRSTTPKGAELTIEVLDSIPPGLVPSDRVAVQLAAGAFERAFGTKPVRIGSGGTLALFSSYAQRGVPVIGTGFADPRAPVHAPNEWFPLSNLSSGVASVSEMLLAFGVLPGPHARSDPANQT